MIDIYQFLKQQPVNYGRLKYGNSLDVNFLLCFSISLKIISDTLFCGVIIAYKVMEYDFGTCFMSDNFCVVILSKIVI